MRIHIPQTCVLFSLQNVTKTIRLSNMCSCEKLYHTDVKKKTKIESLLLGQVFKPRLNTSPNRGFNLPQKQSLNQPVGNFLVRTYEVICHMGPFLCKLSYPVSAYKIHLIYTAPQNPALLPGRDAA